MKRLLCFLLAACLLLPLLAACGSSNTTIKVGVLAGTTGMGAVKMIEDADARYEITIYPATTPEALLNDLTAGVVDLAAIPTNAAAKLYNKTTGSIRMLALNTLGVLHLVDTTGTVSSLADLEGKTVYVPMAGQNPEYILRHILAENGINATVETSITDADALSTALLSSEGENAAVQIAVLPQPKVTVVKNQAAAASIALNTLDLSTEWNEIEETTIAQGCLVGRAEFVDNNQRAVKEFLAAYKASIEYVAAPENLDAVANLIVANGIIPKAPIAKAALPYCGLAYVDSKTMKDTLTTFYGILYDFDAKAVGGSLPDENFYFNAD